MKTNPIALVQIVNAAINSYKTRVITVAMEKGNNEKSLEDQIGFTNLLLQ